MSLLTKIKYSFLSKGMDKKTFTVISFKGFEAISQPYNFEILLVSEKSDIDPLNVLQNPAVFTIHRDEEEDVKFNGILMQFQETQEFDGNLFFKAVLTPKLWWLSLTHHNQVFLDLSAPDIMEHALKDGGLNPGIDFSFNLMNSYDPLEYICQYDESHFNFASRWAEREGMYYFFEQTQPGEKIIFTDSKMEHKDLLLGKDLIYLPQSGLDALHTKEVIQNFICMHNMLPQKVFLKDYNYLKPSFSIEGMADVDENGRGENYVYGEHFDTPEEGNRLAQIRAEALICRKSIFHGESSVPFIVPGYTFDLNDHYKNAYNRKYLVTDVTHEGHQKGYLLAGLSKVLEKSDEEMFYSNSFTAIYSDEQFRAQHLSEKPKITGTINAKIDAAGSGEHAELDEHGRYKVVLPFDRSGRTGGKASAFFRMMQPSAGQNQGMHFPLHKGTEVLLTFIDGNPDRPVIAGAMSNPETSSPVNDENQTKSVISTGKSPVDQSIGAGDAKARSNSDTNNFIEFEDAQGSERIRTHSDGDLWQEAQGRYSEYTIGVPSTAEARPTDISGLIDKMYDFKSSSGFAPTGAKLYADTDTYKKTSANDSNISDIQALSDPPTDDEKKKRWQDLVDRGKVIIAKGDTFNTQEGNIYDFGGYWVYNLGNAYVEDHLSQSAELNKTNSFDLLDKAGPSWTKIDWDKGVDTAATSPIAAADILIGSADDWKATSAGDATNVWVNRKFGRSYDYSELDSVAVNKGSSLNIQHGGTHIGVAYRQPSSSGAGSIKAWTWAGPNPEPGGLGAASYAKKWTSKGLPVYDYSSYSKTGVTKEKKWNKFTNQMVSDTTTDIKNGTTTSWKNCKDTGDVLSLNSSKQWQRSVHSFSYNRAHTLKCAINFAAGASFSLNASEQGKVTINWAAVQSFNVSMASDIKLNLKCGFNADISLPFPFLITFKMDLSGLAMNYDKSGFTAKMFGAELKAKKTSAEIVSEGLLALKRTHRVSLEDGQLKFTKRMLTLCM